MIGSPHSTHGWVHHDPPVRWGYPPALPSPPVNPVFAIRPRLWLVSLVMAYLLFI